MGFFPVVLGMLHDTIGDVSWWMCLAYLSGIITLCVIAKGIYNIYFHPLAKFPGPKLAALTNLYYANNIVRGGRSVFKIEQLHKKYGKVIRIAPNELSFATVKAVKDIYGHRGGGVPFKKSPFYNASSTGFGGHVSIASQTDPGEHGKVRKFLSNAFSAKALADQEDLIQRSIDLYIEQIGIYGTKPGGLDMPSWANYLTFDIIGDLAFGKTFQALEKGIPNYWIQIILEQLKIIPLFDVFRRFPSISPIQNWLIPSSIMRQRKKHVRYTREAVQRRIDSGSTRKDFLSNILEKREKSNFSDGEVTVNAGTLVVAGSETTATWLSSTTYYLCKTPRVAEKLKNEIRSAFASLDEITAENTTRLKYLQAVIDEGLRICPPASIGLPRVSPGATVDGYYVPAGTELSSCPWALTHSEEYFRDPYTFAPERWLDDSWGTVKEASNPFSIGSRACLGRNLALVEMRVILAKTFFEYDLEMLDPSLDWNESIRVYFLWQKPELKVRLKKRVM